MRISLVTETYFPQINGVSRALRNLVHHLLHCGAEVQLAVPDYGVASSSIEPSCSVHGIRGVPVPFYPEIRAVFATAGRMGRLFSEFEPDLVHIATEGPMGFAALRAARRKRIPVTSSYHTNFSHYMRWYGIGCLEAPLLKYLRWFHNATEITFCPTRSIQTLLENCGLRNVAIWGRGVDAELFDPARYNPTVRETFGVSATDVPLAVYVGRLAAEKNLDMLLNAMDRLPATVPCNLVLIGDGPERKRLEKRAGERVFFAGYHRGEELAKRMASCDFMVFPSLTETFGNVVLEGMASGLPVIAVDSPGPRDIIRDQETGILIPESCPDAMAESIAKLAGAPVTRQVMGKKARSYACSQSWEAINDVVWQSYGTILADRC